MEPGTPLVAVPRTSDPWSCCGPVEAAGYHGRRDEALILRTRSGEHAAFSELVARHQSRLYTLVLGTLGDEETADDVLCLAVVAAYRNLASWTPDCRPGTWLWLHALNEVFRRLDPPRGNYTLVDVPSE